MSLLKRKIESNIVRPADQARRSFTTVAEVMKGNEKNNTCDIRYIDKDGNVSNKKNVQVLIYNTAIVDWFPLKGEKVYIEDSGDGNIIIKSKYTTDYAASVKADNELKADILQNIYSDFTCGSIF